MSALWRWLGFHVHEWGMWTTAGSLVRLNDGKKVGHYQQRICKTCGKIDQERIW